MYPYLYIIFLVILGTSLKAQIVPLVCDTIVLGNGRTMLVQLDSINTDLIFYRKCRTGATERLQIPMTMIKGVYYASGVNAKPPITVHEMKDSPSESKVPFWFFKNREMESIVHKISTKKTVLIYYKTDKKVVKIKGYMERMNDENLQVRLSPRKMREIHKNSIVKIVFTPEKNAGQKVKKMFMIMLIVVGSIMFFLVVLGGFAGGGLWTPGLFLGILSIVFALLFGFSSRRPVIHNPFSDKWEVIAPDANPPDVEKEMHERP